MIPGVVRISIYNMSAVPPTLVSAMTPTVGVDYLFYLKYSSYLLHRIEYDTRTRSRLSFLACAYLDLGFINFELSSGRTKELFCRAARKGKKVLQKNWLMSTSLLKFLKNVDKNFIYYLSKMLAPIATVPVQTSQRDSIFYYLKKGEVTQLIFIYFFYQ